MDIEIERYQVYTVISRLKDELGRGDFFMALQNQPVALSLYRQFCKHKEPNTLKDLYNQDDNHQELGNFHVRSSYVSEKMFVLDLFPCYLDRFWWLKISALAEQGAWEDLEKFSKSKKSPIGYLPFAEISMKYGSPSEAKKYAARVTPEQKVKAFLVVGDFSQAAEAAVERKNEAEMALILSKCTNASVVAKLEQAKAQLGKK
ncbi:hypothetical protein L345_17577, partial [Ophiophagus hannah]